MAKQIKFDAEARQKILAGVEKLSAAVTSTLGPSGRNVILDKKFGSPQITKDGVTVAKEIELADPFENMGAQMVREVASKTNDVAGDGTTTATLLAEAVYREGLKNITAGANPMALKRGIESATGAVTDAIAKLAKKVKSAEEIILAHELQLLVAQLHFRAAVLRQQHRVADLDVERDLLVVLVHLLADGEHLALDRLLLGCVGDNDAADRLFLFLDRFDENAIAQGSYFHLLVSFRIVSS